MSIYRKPFKTKSRRLQKFSNKKSYWYKNGIQAIKYGENHYNTPVAPISLCPTLPKGESFEVTKSTTFSIAEFINSVIRKA